MSIEEFLTRAGLLWLNGAVLGGVFVGQALPYIVAVVGAALFLVDPDRQKQPARQPQWRKRHTPERGRDDSFSIT